jgi:fibrillarin-like pre-rRNA processing protein
MIKRSKLFGVYEKRGRRRKIYTLSDYSNSVYGETVIKSDKGFFREWIPNRSKLGAAIIKGLKGNYFNEDSFVLYLGASTGTTVSHISDIVKQGHIFAVEFAPRVLRELVFLAEQRQNISPILGDAAQPKQYIDKVVLVDLVFQDIAQPNQVGIFIRNIKTFLKKGGYAMLAIKSRSIDIARKPRDVFNQARAELEKSLEVIEYFELSPEQKDHAFFICRH